MILGEFRRVLSCIIAVECRGAVSYIVVYFRRGRLMLMTVMFPCRGLPTQLIAAAGTAVATTAVLPRVRRERWWRREESMHPP